MAAALFCYVLLLLFRTYFFIRSSSQKQTDLNSLPVPSVYLFIDQKKLLSQNRAMHHRNKMLFHMFIYSLIEGESHETTQKSHIYSSRACTI